MKTCEGPELMTTNAYSAQQAADMLGLTSARVRALAAEMKLGTRLSPRVLFFSAADVEAMRTRRLPGRPRKDASLAE